MIILHSIQSSSLQAFNKSLGWVSGPTESDKALEVFEFSPITAC